MTSFLSCGKCLVCRPRSTNLKSNVSHRIKTELNRNVLNFFLPFISVIKFVNNNFRNLSRFRLWNLRGCEKRKYKNNIVAVKKLHSNLQQNFTNIFTKEALLLGQLSSKNVVKILGVCENPISIMMEHLEFSFVPFGRDIKVNSLDKLLEVFDSENLLPYFPGTGNNIASDIINAICHLHQTDTVHRDIKPRNVLVNNHYYSSLKASRLNAVFQDQTIVCKLGDLGEARSAFAQTSMVTGNTHTRFITRGSTAFMAPEILIQEEILEFAGIDEMKKIDI